MTKFGRGGYRISLWGVGYTHPLTGCGWWADWRNTPAKIRQRLRGEDMTTLSGRGQRITLTHSLRG
jgi:hypothetical protein